MFLLDLLELVLLGRDELSQLFRVQGHAPLLGLVGAAEVDVLDRAHGHELLLGTSLSALSSRPALGSPRSEGSPRLDRREATHAVGVAERLPAAVPARVLRHSLSRRPSRRRPPVHVSDELRGGPGVVRHDGVPRRFHLLAVPSPGRSEVNKDRLAIGHDEKMRSWAMRSYVSHERCSPCVRASVSCCVGGPRRTEQRERDAFEAHRPARGASSVRGRHTRRKRARNGPRRRVQPQRNRKTRAAQRRGGASAAIWPGVAQGAARAGTGTSWHWAKTRPGIKVSEAREDFVARGGIAGVAGRSSAARWAGWILARRRLKRDDKNGIANSDVLRRVIVDQQSRARDAREFG